MSLRLAAAGEHEAANADSQQNEAGGELFGQSYPFRDGLLLLKKSACFHATHRPAAVEIVPSAHVFFMRDRDEGKSNANLAG
jgi:hypothetical protein